MHEQWSPVTLLLSPVTGFKPYCFSGTPMQPVDASILCCQQFLSHVAQKLFIARVLQPLIDKMGAVSRFKAVDMYKKIPKDLTEATLSGAAISVSAAAIMTILLILELSAFLRTQTTSELVVDMSPQEELLKVTFNISFPALSCEFATLDVSDALGKKRMNLTKTIRKSPVDVNLDLAGPVYLEDNHANKAGPKYDEEHLWWEHLDLTHPLTRADFMTTLTHYPIVVVNFYAPWCHWCQRLEPAWEAATAAIHEKYPEQTDGRIRFAKVDCTAEAELCKEHFITGFPSLRVFRRAHDDIYVEGRHQHEAYTGDRTKEALEKFGDSLVLSAGQPHVQHDNLTAAPRVAGCNIAGFVLVKKVPGTLHFTARDEHHSFDHNWMNMTHVIHAFHFGSMPSLQKYKLLQRLHPLGLSKDWLDKLREQRFYSLNPQHTHEHYLQVVRTTVQPLHTGPGSSYDAYEYVVHSHTYISDQQPTAKFSYGLSALQVVVKEQPKHWYKFLTTTCAVIGGIFTVAGILDTMLYSTLNMARKVELGKHG